MSEDEIQKVADQVVQRLMAAANQEKVESTALEAAKGKVVTYAEEVVLARIGFYERAAKYGGALVLAVGVFVGWTEYSKFEEHVTDLVVNKVSPNVSVKVIRELERARFAMRLEGYRASLARQAQPRLTDLEVQELLSEIKRPDVPVQDFVDGTRVLRTTAVVKAHAAELRSDIRTLLNDTRTQWQDIPSYENAKRYTAMIDTSIRYGIEVGPWVVQDALASTGGHRRGLVLSAANALVRSNMVIAPADREAMVHAILTLTEDPDISLAARIDPESPALQSRIAELCPRDGRQCAAELFAILPLTKGYENPGHARPSRKLASEMLSLMSSLEPEDCDIVNGAASTCTLEPKAMADMHRVFRQCGMYLELDSPSIGQGLDVEVIAASVAKDHVEFQLRPAHSDGEPATIELPIAPNDTLLDASVRFLRLNAPPWSASDSALSDSGLSRSPFPGER